MAEGFSIGRLATLTGLPVKTIRFYSDTGLVPPTGRTQAGHRRYGVTDVARLQLVRALRDLDVDLGTIGQLLAGRTELGELLAAHVAALQARDRALHRQLAVVRAAAASPTEATLGRVHALARLEAAERGWLLDRFWDRVTEGLPGGEAVDRLRQAGTPELPADPTGEQLDAWLELAELVADEDFQRTTRANAAWGAELTGDVADPDAWPRQIGAGLAAAAELRADGVEPSDARAAAAVTLMTRDLAAAHGRRDGPAFRRWLAEELDAHTDPRAERYWQLVGIIQGRSGEEFATRIADHAWLMAALREHAAPPVSPTGGQGSRAARAKESAAMRAADLSPLFEASGPFLSLYLAAGGDVENAASRLELRWKSTRGDLQEQEVPIAVLEAVDPLVEGGHTAGATLAVIVSVDGAAYATGLPTPPVRDVLARWAAVPYVLPLLAHAQSQFPYAAVLASRGSAEIVARSPDGERSEQVEGEQGPQLHRSAPGGWSQPRHQHRAEVIWERNASEVADVLTRIVDDVRPRFVAAAGDVRALQLLREQSPKRVRELLQVVGGEFPSMDPVLDKAAELVEAEARRDADALRERLAQERGRGPGGLAAEGAEATLAALAKSQVEVLLVADDPDDERRAWFGAAPQQLALDRETVEAIGEPTPVEGRLPDVAVRAALGSSAGVHVLDPDDAGLQDGLGAVLRFADQEVT